MSEPIRIGPPDEEIYGPSPREQPWRRFTKYVRVLHRVEQDVADRYVVREVWLDVGHQRFKFNADISMSEDQAQWMAEQLAKALSHIFESERG